MMQGRIDVVRPDGLIEGWCWNDESPESRLNVTVLIDGIEAGSAVAAIYREDLRLAKIGDGCHAFSFVTQILPSSDKRTQNYTLIESETRRPCGAPLVVQNKEAISLDNRLLELETRNRLLTTRLDELAQRDARSSSAELFSVVGEFFARLAKDMERGEPLGIDRRLGEMAQAASKSLGLLVFPTPEQATMTILVQARTSLAQTHACLASLLRAGAGGMARIVVIDDGQAQDAVLLPSLVRGIRYVHTVAALTSEWAAAESTDQADCILMLSGAALVDEHFLREISAALDANGNAAAMGAHAARTGMRFTAGGLILNDGTLEDCATAGHPERHADLSAVYPAHAVSYQAAAFRRSAWRAVGGLDRAFEDDLGAAVIDLCFRLRQEGWSVLTDPLATVELQPSFGEESWIPRGVGGNSHSTELLRHRWFDVLVSHPPLYGGHAAVVGIPGEFKNELTAARKLREWGYSVQYLSAAGLHREEAHDLRRAGVVATVANDIGKTLAAGGATLVYTEDTSAALDFVPHGGQLLVGLSALEHSRAASSEKGVTSGAESSVSDLPMRQVAGL